MSKAELIAQPRAERRSIIPACATNGAFVIIVERTTGAISARTQLQIVPDQCCAPASS
jgi:hypothetical protein